MWRWTTSAAATARGPQQRGVTRATSWPRPHGRDATRSTAGCRSGSRRSPPHDPRDGRPALPDDDLEGRRAALDGRAGRALRQGVRARARAAVCHQPGVGVGSDAGPSGAARQLAAVGGQYMARAATMGAYSSPRSRTPAARRASGPGRAALIRRPGTAWCPAPSPTRPSTRVYRVETGPFFIATVVRQHELIAPYLRR